MSREELEKPLLIAGLEELDLALKDLHRLIIEPDEGVRLALLHLEGDAKDLERLTAKAEEWPPNVDIFNTLRLDGSEEFHSNFLAWLLRPRGSHGLGGYFLREFLKSSGSPRAIPTRAIDGTMVNREHSISLGVDTGRLDIRIINVESKFLCAIENKVWSPESGNQLAFYRKALAEHCSDYTVHCVFLTPSGEVPDNPREREHWKRMSYSTVLQLIDRTVQEKGGFAGEEVTTLLRQYATTLRRNIVPDVSNDVHQLARKIYRKHKQAIDLIIEHRERYEPNYALEGYRMVREAVGARREWNESRCNSFYARFISAEWSKYEELEVNGWPDYLLQFQVHTTNHLADLSLFLSWRGNENLRRKIFDRLSARPELFVGDFSSFTDDSIGMSIGNILKESDYADWWDEEKTRETVARRLDEFARGQFPEINRVIVECLEDYRAGK